MPNIIINNYCNQKCSYCFASDNMKNKTLRKDMSITTFLQILKFLKNNNDNNVRILGGEPLLSPNIKNFLNISLKGGFKIIIFSNLNIPHNKLKNIFSKLKNNSQIRINCNINDLSFYKSHEIKNIFENLSYISSIGIKVILGYNITKLKNYPNFHFYIAKKFGISSINLKITNSSIGYNKLLLNTSSKNLGKYIYNILKKNHEKFYFFISCGLDKSIFSKEELFYIKQKTNINLKFGCNGNDGKFDFNTDGSIFKCFPLESLFISKEINVKSLLSKKIKTDFIINRFKKFHSSGKCTAHK